MHHSMFPICTQELLGTAQHLCQQTWTHGLSGIHRPTPLPKRTDQPLFLQHQDFPPTAPPHWAGSPGEGKEVWFDLTSHSDRVQGEGSPAHRQAVDAHTGPGCLWEWEVKAPGFVSSGRSWHCSPSLPLLHYVLFYLFAFARLRRLCWAKKPADNALFSLRT